MQIAHVFPNVKNSFSLTCWRYPFWYHGEIVQLRHKVRKVVSWCRLIAKKTVFLHEERNPWKNKGCVVWRGLVTAEIKKSVVSLTPRKIFLHLQESTNEFFCDSAITWKPSFSLICCEEELLCAIILAQTKARAVISYDGKIFIARWTEYCVW